MFKTIFNKLKKKKKKKKRKKERKFDMHVAVTP
jgi:hypothetical protein